MRTTFSQCYQWQRPWIRKIKEKVAPHLLEEDLQEDLCHGTDLLVLKPILEVGLLRIGCRLRRPKYRRLYPWDTTVTTDRESGADAEYPKIHAGMVTLLFYGHTTAELDEGGEIEPWYLYWAKKWCSYDIAHGDAIPKLRNRDEDGIGCWFKPYDIRKMEAKYPGTVLASCPALELWRPPRNLELVFPRAK